MSMTRAGVGLSCVKTRSQGMGGGLYGRCDFVFRNRNRNRNRNSPREKKDFFFLFYRGITITITITITISNSISHRYVHTTPRGIRIVFLHISRQGELNSLVKKVLHLIS